MVGDQLPANRRRRARWACPAKGLEAVESGGLGVERGREKAPGAQQGARDFTLKATGHVQLRAWLSSGVLADRVLSPVRWLRLDSMELMT